MKHYLPLFVVFSLIAWPLMAQEVHEHKPAEKAEQAHSDDHHKADQHKEMEVHAGHVHHQANIQILKTATTLLFELDFPAGDVKDKSLAALYKIGNPDHIFHIDSFNASCAFTKSSFAKKTVGGSHADYRFSFEYTCTEPLEIKSIDLNPLFDLPIDVEMAQTHIIMGDQILPPVEIKKKNALIKLKKTS